MRFWFRRLLHFCWSLQTLPLLLWNDAMSKTMRIPEKSLWCFAHASQHSCFLWEKGMKRSTESGFKFTLWFPRFKKPLVGVCYTKGWSHSHRPCESRMFLKHNLNIRLNTLFQPCFRSIELLSRELFTNRTQYIYYIIVYNMQHATALLRFGLKLFSSSGHSNRIITLRTLNK